MPSYLVSIDMVDAYGRSARKTFETVPTMADQTAALAAAASLVADIAGLSELDVLAYSVSQRVVYSDAVTAGANRDEGVTLVLRKVDNYKGVIKVPGPINDIFNTDGSVDLADAAVTSFVSNFLTGGDFVFSDGEQATSLIAGKLDR